MTRGLVTIATGNIHYYQIAANLLKSYRFFSKSPLPFAIIAEEKNDYTALFDEVILVKDATRSFMDKFLLLKHCPYDESLFFDADSLAYGDLNDYWNCFENASDFSSAGANFPRDSSGAWYNVEDIGKYGIHLPYKSRVHTGVCFIRKNDSLKKLFEDCMELSRNYSQLHFHSFPNSKDECILGVALPMNGMTATPIPHKMLAAYPCLTSKRIDILHDVLSYKTPWCDIEQGILLHWGTAQTYTPLYRFNVKCLDYRIQYKDCKPPLIKKLWYSTKLYLWLLYIPYLMSCISKYIGLIWKKTRKIILKTT